MIPMTPALPLVGHPLAGGGMSSPSFCLFSYFITLYIPYLKHQIRLTNKALRNYNLLIINLIQEGFNGCFELLVAACHD